MLAYVEYKLAKSTFCRQFTEKHGKPPSPADVETFLLSFDERRLDQLREAAFIYLVTFADDYSKDEIAEARRDGENSAIVREAQKQGGLMRGFLVNLGASVAFSAGVFLLVASVALLNPESKVAKVMKALSDDNTDVYISRRLPAPEPEMEPQRLPRSTEK